MTEVEEVTASVTSMIATSYSGGSAAAPAPAEEFEPFEFDEDFQRKIAAHVLADYSFMRSVGHLIKPEYFEQVGEAAIVNMAKKYWDKYAAVPPKSTHGLLLKAELDSGAIRGDAKSEAVAAIKRLWQEDLGGSKHVAEQVAEFCRHQAMSQAILKSVDYLGAKKFEKIELAVKEAIGIGISEDGDEYDYFERINERTETRLDKAAGKLPPQGITTGHQKMDDVLYHRGWGKRELSVLMGGAKTGKTTAMIGFAKSASLAGKNVLYVTLEVSAAIISDRLDASMSDNMMKELGKNIHDIDSKIRDIHKRAGCLKIHEYPPGSFTPSQLERLIEKYEAKGIIFELVVVDYADIMAPDHRINDPIENSKQTYIGLRAVAFNKNVAVLSATQTNRDGFKATVAKADHIADDFNKVRIVDLLISINITEEERANGQARLFFAASRNQESGFTIFVKSDISRMIFIKSILKIE
jgi:replicative DNA helicase